MFKNCIFFIEEVKEEDESMADSEPTLPGKPVFTMRMAKNRPDKVIRRKQLKAKSKAISDQIKKRKHLLKKKKSTKG